MSAIPADKVQEAIRKWWIIRDLVDINTYFQNPLSFDGLVDWLLKYSKTLENPQNADHA
jgi:hypothetical protein